MTKYIYFYLILFLFSSCSFDTRSGIWTQEKKLVETNQNEKIIKQLFKENISDENEFNKDLEIQFSTINFNKINANHNNSSISKLSLKLKKLSKY